MVELVISDYINDSLLKNKYPPTDIIDKKFGKFKNFAI